MTNLQQIYNGEGKKSVAKEVLNQLEISERLKKEIPKCRIHVQIPQLYRDYLRITAKSQWKLGERLSEIILSDVRKVAEEELGIF